MDSPLQKWPKTGLLACVAGVIGALSVDFLKDDRVVISSNPNVSGMRVVRVDGMSAEHRTKRFFIPTTPHTLVTAGKRSLTISMTDKNDKGKTVVEHTIEAEIYNGVEYSLSKDADGLPSVVITKI